MSAPLTTAQKASLAMLATQAYSFRAALARGRGETVCVKSATITEWRRAEVAKAVGKHGLTCCGQSDYADVRAHFQNLLNRPDRALATMMRGTDNARRQYEWKILEALRTLGKPATYAEGIARRMFKGTALLDCSTDQLRKILAALTYQKQRTAA